MKPSPDLLVRFGRQLREFRRERGFSQEEFAHRCGLDRTYISGIERGRRNVGLLNIGVIATALGLKISILMEGVD